MFNKKILLIIFLLTSAFIFLGSNFKVKADRTTTIFDQMSRTAANVVASHTIYFLSPGGISAGNSFAVNLPSAFIFGSSYDFNDVTFAEGSTSNCLTASFTPKTLGSSASGSTWGVSKTGSTIITITSGTDTINTNRCIRVELLTNGVNHTLTNPNVTSNTVYNINVTAHNDVGEASVIILGDASVSNVDQVTLAANVSTSILLAIDTVTVGCNNTTQTSYSNQIVNFGDLYPGILKKSGNDISFVCIEAGSNSVNGFRILTSSSRVNSVGGLVSTGGDIASATANLNVGSSGYGLRVASLGTPTIGSFNAASPFNSVTSGDIGLISGSLGVASEIVNSSAPVRSGNAARIAIELAAKADTATLSGNYSDILTFTAFTNL